MKVLKKGEGNQATCESCQSVLEFEASDVIRKNLGRDEDGDEMYGYSIHCPNCKHEVRLSGITGAMKARVAEIQRNRDLADYDL